MKYFKSFPEALFFGHLIMSYISDLQCRIDALYYIPTLLLSYYFPAFICIYLNKI